MQNLAAKASHDTAYRCVEIKKSSDVVQSRDEAQTYAHIWMTNCAATCNQFLNLDVSYSVRVFISMQPVARLCSILPICYVVSGHFTYYCSTLAVADLAVFPPFAMR